MGRLSKTMFAALFFSVKAAVTLDQSVQEAVPAESAVSTVQSSTDEVIQLSPALTLATKPDCQVSTILGLPSSS